MYGIARRWLPTHEDAEDCVQDVLAALVGADLPTYELLCAMVQRHAISLWRREHCRGRHGEQPYNVLSLEAERERRLLPDWGDRAADARSDAIAEQVIARLELQRILREQSTMVYLASGWSVSELADAQGVSRQAIKMQAWRWRRAA